MAERKVREEEEEDPSILTARPRSSTSSSASVFAAAKLQQRNLPREADADPSSKSWCTRLPASAAYSVPEVKHQFSRDGPLVPDRKSCVCADRLCLGRMENQNGFINVFPHLSPRACPPSPQLVGLHSVIIALLQRGTPVRARRTTVRCKPATLCWGWGSAPHPLLVSSTTPTSRLLVMRGQHEWGNWRLDDRCEGFSNPTRALESCGRNSCSYMSWYLRTAFVMNREPRNLDADPFVSKAVTAVGDQVRYFYPYESSAQPRRWESVRN